MSDNISISSNELNSVLFESDSEDEAQELLESPCRYKQNLHGKLDLLDMWSLPDNIRELKKKIQNKKFILVDSYTVAGVRYKLLDTVELRPTNTQKHGDLLLIKKIKIYADPNIDVVFSGNIFRRSTNFFFGRHESTEHTLLAHVVHNEDGNVLRSAEVNVKPQEILIGRELELTIDPFSKTINPEINGSKSPKFTCRTVFISYYTAQPLDKKQKPFEWVLRHLYPSEVPHRQSCQKSRCGAGKEKSFKGGFTYVSGFSGGGGDVQAARQAGAKVLLAFEINDNACHTLHHNHPQVPIFHGDQWEVTQGQMSNILKFGHVDMLHLSTECKYFSPDHTQPGPTDEVSSALLFCTAAQLAHFKPLIHTQEQTRGLFSRHPQYFLRLISDIFESGYNIRWSILDFRNLSLVARRRRLVIISARNGVALPNFPESAHGEPGSGLRPLTNLYDVIGDISEDSTLHSSLAVQSPLSSEVTKRAKTGYDPSDYVVPCLTTNGGKGYHWSGRRFTIRELATLQQFPPKYRFIRNNRNIMKQIGNAIPPLVWEKFIREIMKTVYDYKAGRISDY